MIHLFCKHLSRYWDVAAAGNGAMVTGFGRTGKVGGWDLESSVRAAVRGLAKVFLVFSYRGVVGGRAGYELAQRRGSSVFSLL